jgi:predicted nucleic acid-binding protein
MAKTVRILLDINIILDVLQERIPHYESSSQLLALAETKRIQGLISAHTVTTLFYLVSKDKSPDQARVTITGLLQFLMVAPVDQNTIEQALTLPYKDFEDAVQMIAAVQCKADGLITRNAKDFQPALVPIYQPTDFLASL